MKKPKAYVVGDSHVKRLSKGIINHFVKEKNVFLKYFYGATTKRIKHHILPTLHDDEPESVVIHAGTNDIVDGNCVNIVRPLELSKNIIEIGKLCKDFGVKHIAISGILPRKDVESQKIIDEVNSSLDSMCQFYNFTFLNPVHNINNKFLAPDGTHLSDIGTRFLGDNIIDYLNKV